MMTNFLGILSSVLLAAASVSHAVEHWDYIVIGAGPAGLQMGWQLKSSARNYVIFERNNISGSFFGRYPRHGKLLSINKRFTGRTNKEFNLRHDWNSLLSDDETLQFRHFSRDFYPHRQAMVDYLNAYQRRLGINVRFNTNIHNIRRYAATELAQKGERFLMADQFGKHFSCRCLIIASGMWKPNIPDIAGIHLLDGYENISTNPEQYQGKTVLVVGHGNSAFETADTAFTGANFVHVVGRSRIRLAWETMYMGDVRSINNQILDNYQLKTQDGVIEGPLHQVVFEKIGNKFRMKLNTTNVKIPDNFSFREVYDRVIRCLGFMFDDSPFKKSCRPMTCPSPLSKYPEIGHDYQSANIRGLYFAGASTHSLDYRKSAGGFISGFRYTVQALHRLLEWRYEGVPWPSTTHPISQLVSHVVKIINEASGIYQMFSVLGEIIALERNGQMFKHFQNFPINLLSNFTAVAGSDITEFIVIVMQRNDNFFGPGKDTFRRGRFNASPENANASNSLHPVLYYYTQLPEDMPRLKGAILPPADLVHHVVEDLTSYLSPSSHIIPLQRFLQSCFRLNLRMLNRKSCFKQGLTSKTVAVSCSYLHDPETV